MLANDSFHIAVLAGDGIGPAVMAPALEVLRRVAAATSGLNFRFTAAPAGARHYRDTGQSLPESTVKLCREADAILLGGAGCRRCAIPARNDRPWNLGFIPLYRPLL
jgi:3-isopropylmalate dehydrogenase